MGRSSSNRKLSLTLAILMSVQGISQGAVANPVCPPPLLQSREAQAEAQVDMVLAVADEMSAYLKRGKKDISGLIEWLGHGEEWPQTTAKECRENNYCLMLRRDIHILHKRLRLNIALAWSPTTSGYDFGKIETAGNPHMFAPIYSPLSGRFQDLTPSERKIAEEKLGNFWDGKGSTPEERELHEFLTGQKLPQQIPGVIEDYIEILKRRVIAFSKDPWQLEKMKSQLEAFEKTRRFANRSERIEKAMLIGDEGWRHYRQRRLFQFQQALVAEIWGMVDSFRPIAYLREARITPSALRAALQSSIQDAARLEQQVARSREVILPYKGPSAAYLINHRAGGNESRKEAEFLLDFSAIVKQVVDKNPRHCNAYVGLRERIDRLNMAWNILLTGALTAPLILLFPPAAVALGTMGGAGIAVASGAAASVLTYDAISRYQNLSAQYFAHWTPDEAGAFLTDSQELAQSQKEAVLSPAAFALSIGVPSVRASRLGKLFSSSP